MSYCKSNNNLQSHSNHVVLNTSFRYSLVYIKYFMPSILNKAQYFPRYIEESSIWDFIHNDTE